MSKYQNFIGIDIGKFNFVAALHGSSKTREYENTPAGLKEFRKDFRRELPTALVVLETTGGYEMKVLLFLCDKQYNVHRANTRKVKNFIHSFGSKAKTDALDAKALALYGFERHQHLSIYTPVSQNQSSLYELVQRRKDLKQMLVAEKNRLKAPKISDIIKTSCELMIESLNVQVKQITMQIEKLIQSDPSYAARADVLKTIPGIADITAYNLLALLPELGTLTRKQIASLAGLAPRANDSGKHKGYRRTGHGRDSIKSTLYTSAMAARNSHSHLKAYYDSLIGRGKMKKVALTALMRKIIVIANARIKDLTC